MDAKIKKCCPNCSQLYYIKTSTQPKGNLPLFLTCGHSMCESCVTNILKCAEPIECKICHRDMEINAADLELLTQNKIKVYKLCPVNLPLLGELALQLIEKSPEQKNKTEDYFIDLKAIIDSTDSCKGQCMECHNHTRKMCQQCATILCEACFNKSHKNFIIFKNHVLQNIEQVQQSSTCKLHRDKPLDYYCKDCCKSVCMDCLVVGGEKSCKNHNVVSMQEVNEGFLEEINDICPKVNEVFRRLTKTAVDVGHLLHNVENETGSSSELTQLIATIEQHFSKLMAAIQKHKHEVISIIANLKNTEKDSLYKAKNDLEVNITKARKLLNTMNLCTDIDKAKQLNLSALLDDAKQIVETPWYLTKEETKDKLEIVANEDQCSLVSDYIHLEGNASAAYKLKSTTELGPDVEIPPAPVAPVFPPELPKDVRLKTQQVVKKPETNYGFIKDVPNYRSKSSSVSSLNSQDSSDSQKFYNRGGRMSGDGFQRQTVPTVQPVKPFAETKLRVDMQELIYITHIVDPHHFYVQRACYQSVVKEMIAEFRNAKTLPTPSINHVAEGKVYLVYNKADDMWQRCRVVSINRKNQSNPVFLVFCIDFGSTEAVTIEKLRLLPPARISSPLPLAMKCALHNCDPKILSWTDEDSYLIQKIVDNKQAIIHVRKIRSPNESLLIELECDVTTFDHGISLAHALCFHGRARIPNKRLPYPKARMTANKPRLYTDNTSYQQKSVEDVNITTIVSPDKFFVRKCHLHKVYEKLCKDMEQEYGSHDSVANVYLPEVGVVYAVNVEKSGEDARGTWTRGVVHELPGRQRVRVLLPDSGELLLVHWAQLRHIHHKFTTVCALAQECYLAGVTPLQKRWTGASVALLQRFANRTLQMHVEDTRRGALGVSLYDRQDEDNVVCVNTEMIKHKFAVTFGLYMFNKNADLEDQVYTYKTPLDEPQKPPKKPKEVTILQKKVPKANDKEMEAKDKGPLKIEAKLLRYQSPSLVYVSLVHQQKTFNELYEKIQSYYSAKKGQGKEEWRVGDRCCTVCIQSQTWRRAIIVSINEGKAEVFFSDFACVETVPLADLMELAPEFSAIGDACLKCHLSGIMPADGGKEWPTITKEYLKELLEVYQRIFITKLGDFKNNSMPVEIWVYHTIQGGALEPNKSEWRCLNKKIVEQGLAVPDKTQPGSSDTNATQNDMLSFLQNVAGSINDWLVLDTMPLKPLDAEPSSDVKTPSPVESPLTLQPEEADGSNTIYITDWLPPEPFACEEFTAMPTNVDNEGVIYLHDVAQRDTLDLIRKALDVRFKAPDPKAKYVRWTVGEPCVALYYLDNRFYRGRIMDVDAENSTCVVHYIDYGNEETCSFENLRKSIALHQIPTQAHKCALARIRPINGYWDRDTLDYIHKSIVEKNCFVKIFGNPIGDVHQIDLKFDKLWINDHLVEFDMAEYADGSKAVVRKFAPDKTKKQSPRKEIVEPVVAPVDNDPDYVVVEDDANDESFKSLIEKDWNKLMESEGESDEKDCLEEKILTFPKYDKDEFMCRIMLINDPRVLNLTIQHDDETDELYEGMYAEIQEEYENQPPLNGEFPNKACIARFNQDGQWYRAKILEYSEASYELKVLYVDYGNKEVVSLADVREISEPWMSLPPSTIQAKLHGVEINPEVEKSVLSEQYREAFIDQPEPFNVKVISYDGDLPLVELRRENGELAYENLIKTKAFLIDSTDVD